MVSRDRQRISKIKEYCEDIKATLIRYGPFFETFQADRDFQHSISFCILQIGELVGGLTEEYRAATNSRMQWQQIRGIRNIVAHNYGGINLEIIWDVATIDIPELDQFCCDELVNAE